MDTENRVMVVRCREVEEMMNEGFKRHKLLGIK